MRTVPVLALQILLLLWAVPFIVQHQRNRGRPIVVKAQAARWGMLLQAIAFAVAWFHPQLMGVWGNFPAWRMVATLVFGACALAFAYAAVFTLGKQWRWDAALIEDHELVQSGPYALVRHPIYASVIAMLLATGFAVSGWAQFAIAAVLVIAGTEIRVRAEERLLANRFGPQFNAYRARVPAYVPFLR
jgi:protein-S-isoprenylcysteine O-methyltransferase Ste14